jgi:hypothetical protein
MVGVNTNPVLDDGRQVLPHQVQLHIRQRTQHVIGAGQVQLLDAGKQHKADLQSHG